MDSRHGTEEILRRAGQALERRRADAKRLAESAAAWCGDGLTIPPMPIRQ
ncbi:hypothetical protein LX16_3563 [Stackebrandtia albiflava]|uniref:Uncharacterized protein n=1 Tax=Stackebrandtia albiflava TaxID=406432 RepID=A0A562V4I0_9ACTN|nr:hypothetical protein LX16_3563 [Stackebrandtia albiflava]